MRRCGSSSSGGGIAGIAGIGGPGASAIEASARVLAVADGE